MYRLEMQDVPATGTGRLDGLEVRADACALFIDIDGTLLDMAPTPDAVQVPPGLVATLTDLSDTFGGAVALITGRRVADADRFFAPLKLAVSGVHGAEARNGRDGGTALLAGLVPDGLTAAVRDVAKARPGILVEDKGSGLAVHYRNAPEQRTALKLELGRALGPWKGFAVRTGRKVIDIVPKAHSKATGLAWLMTLPEFQGRRPIMIGDDHGDEPAIRAAERLGGIGLTVAGEHFTPERADFMTPASVRCWLASLCPP
ncbi:MAG: trehalose-phosphatase [Hyphomicrobiaceae bacterium]|nr:trehalose-phosphatase [Hyphomicrobiaceae bacterium]